jgi:hypothetical protein
MSIKLEYFTLTFLLLLSCADQETHKTDRWKIDSYEGTSICDFTFDPITKNRVTETFLGLNDSVQAKLELHLSDDANFKIVKSESVVLTGSWHIINSKTLLLTSKSDSWEMEIVTQNAESLVLKADAYPDMVNVLITLKH